MPNVKWFSMCGDSEKVTAWSAREDDYHGFVVGTLFRRAAGGFYFEGAGWAVNAATKATLARPTCTLEDAKRELERVWASPE